MNREAFKLRMQSLKSYREDNPGKGYLDWKALYEIPMVAEGGEIPPTRTDYDRTNPYTGKQLLSGAVNSLLDLRDAADFTPVGDVLAIKDTYDAAKLGDWLGMGLAAAGMLPFVPNLSKARRTVKLPKRDIPTVHKNLTEDRINELLKQREAYKPLQPEAILEDRSDIANAVNRVVESLDNNAYARARNVDLLYGTNYVGAYDKLKRNYEDIQLFDVIADKNLDRDVLGARGRTKLSDDAAFDLAIEGKPIDDIRRYEIVAKPGEATEAVVHHEMGHIVDLMQLKGYNSSNIHNNGLLKALENDNNFLDDRTLLTIFPGLNIPGYKGYQRTGSELKSFMNQTRKSMELKGIINRLTDPIDQKQIDRYMEDLPFNSSENVIYKSFKDPQTYLKWMNVIPVVGLAPAAINKFYTDNNQDQLEAN